MKEFLRTSEGQDCADTAIRRSKDDSHVPGEGGLHVQYVHNNMNKLSPLSSMHEVESLIDLLEGQSVSHKLIHFQFLIHVVLHQLRDTLHTLPAWEQTP